VETYPVSDEKDHQARRRRTHIAELCGTVWLPYGSGQRPERMPDGSLAERKTHYARDGGRGALWSTGDAAVLARAQRLVREPGSWVRSPIIPEAER
jgi:hypothetical protein